MHPDYLQHFACKKIYVNGLNWKQDFLLCELRQHTLFFQGLILRFKYNFFSLIFISAGLLFMYMFSKPQKKNRKMFQYIAIGVRYTEAESFKQCGHQNQILSQCCHENLYNNSWLISLHCLSPLGSPQQDTLPNFSIIILFSRSVNRDEVTFCTWEIAVWYPTEGITPMEARNPIRCRQIQKSLNTKMEIARLPWYFDKRFFKPNNNARRTPYK